MDDFEDPITDAADRRDNRTAVFVVTVGATVVGLASIILMASGIH
jgi:hypothetical protein